MRTTALLALVATGASLGSAIELAPRSANPRVISLDIERTTVSNILAHDKARLEKLLKRQKTVEQALDNQGNLYYANITLGSPAQSLRVHIDTGSSDLWVNVANSTLCRSNADNCEGGTYNAARSSNHKYVNSDFNITYVDGSGASGDYVTDTIGFGGVQVQNFQFGLGESSQSQQGVLGIGYSGNEVQVVSAGDQPYPNLPQALQNSGYINRNAYSLWLNDLDASTGTILFGGVNRAKYQGTLRTVPVYRARGQYIQFIIAMSSFGFNGSAVTSRNLPSPVILDSGSTLTRLPNDIVAAIYDQLDITYDQQSGVGLAPCAQKSQPGYLEFGFSGINIQVPFDELFVNAGTDAQGNPLTFDDGTLACLFGIAPAAGIIPILGDTFLRSAYVVYDLERNEVSLAQTVYNSTENDIVEIASGTGLIPGATPAASTVTSLAVGTATASARIGSVTGSLTLTNSQTRATGSSARTSASSAASSSSSANAAYATGVPSYFAGAALAVGAGLLL